MMISREAIIKRLLRNNKLSDAAKFEVINLLFSDEYYDVPEKYEPKQFEEDKQSMDWEFDNTKQEKVKEYMEHMPKEENKAFKPLHQGRLIFVDEDDYAEKLRQNELNKHQDELNRKCKDYVKYKQAVDKMTKKMKRSFKLSKDKQFNALVDKLADKM